MTPTADWRPVTWPLIASRLAHCLRQCHSAHDVDEDAADTGHVARDNVVLKKFTFALSAPDDFLVMIFYSCERDHEMMRTKV